MRKCSELILLAIKQKLDFLRDKFKGELKSFKARAKEIIKGLLDLRCSVSSAKDVENRFAVREKAKRFLEEEE